MTSLNREERHLIAIQGLDYFASGLASIFVTIFLFAHSDLRTTVLFQLLMFSSLLVFFVLSGWSLQKFSSGTHMKVGIASAAIFYFLLFLLQGNTIHYLVPLAIFNGFGSGIYWAAFNFNQYIFSNAAKRERYFGYSLAVVNFLSALSQFLGGIVITVTATKLSLGIGTGYATLFFLVFLILAFMVFFIGKLPKHEVPSFSYRHLFSKKCPITWKLVLWQHALMGLFDVSLDTIAGILFYLILKQEVLIGAAQTVGIILGAVGGLISAKLLEKQHQYFWLGSIGIALALTMFAFMQNTTGLWIFVVVSGFCSPFLKTWISSVWFKTMDTIHEHWKNKYHLLMERDISLGLCRILSLIFLYVYLAYGDQVVLARQWLTVLPLLPLAIGILLHMCGKTTDSVTAENPPLSPQTTL
jgi:MFS transporter, YQGE family, putative transporter